MESPTKVLCEQLDHFHLSAPVEGSSKSHFPVLMRNDKFENTDYDESVQNNWDEQDTVIHKTDVDVSLADFMKVKLQLEKEAESKDLKLKPKLINKVEDPNSTWEELKKNYNINNEDIYFDPDETEIQLSDSELSEFNKSTFSFQELPKIKMSGSTLNSNNNNLKFIDSPLDSPKLIKPNLISIQKPINFKVPLKLISPNDLEMIYDKKQEKWINNNENNKENNNSTNPDLTLNYDISFLESKKTLISSLTNIIGSDENWDKVNNLNISNKNLESLIGLNEFLPCLVNLNLKSNKITNFDGIPLNIKELNLSRNLICDHLSNISNFKNLSSIDLSFNKISRMDSFDNLKFLKKLNLSNNKIKKLSNLNNVEILNLSNNQLNGVLDFKNFEFNNLIELNLSKNNLNLIKNLNSIKNLKILKVNNNNLKNLNKLNSTLHHLELVGNSIKLNLGSNDELIFLKNLHIDGNINLIGNFLHLKIFHVENYYSLTFLKSYDNNIIINPNLDNLSIINSNLTHKNFNDILLKFPNLTKINFKNNLIHGNFLNLVNFLANYKGILKFFNLDDNPLITYLKTDDQRNRYKEMISQIMNDNI